MMEIVVSIEVDREAEEAFAYLSDWTNNPKWQDGMKDCTWTSEPPLRVGSTYDQHAVFRGRDIISSFEVVELEPGRRLRMKTTKSTIPLDVTRKVDPIGDGRSRITAIVRGAPTGLLKLFTPLTRRMVQRNVEADYERLRELLNSSE